MDNIEITYTDNKEKVVIKRVATSKFKDLRTLQHLVLTDFIKYDTRIGEILSEESCLTNLINLAKFLPVVGKTKNASLDINRMSFEDIKSVFYTQTKPNHDGSYPEDGHVWEPGLVAVLHELEYTNSLKKIWDQIMQEETQKTQQERKKAEETLPVETQT